ncbi:MAG: NAD-dependent epimerase/dehydratase family protein [Deltaproteobacteria bacterium]|nr:NAD-dependent epimerase/dehydratase family protein [Deltaproteobacteria bacterium]
MAWKGRRVLVTGGAGFIGSNLVVRLVGEGAVVRVVDAMLPLLGGNPFNLAPVKDDIELRQVDLRDLSAAQSAVEGMEYIFNLAGNVSHLDSMQEPLTDLTINVNAQVNTLEACRAKNRDAMIVYTSTRQLYGVPQYLPVDERHPVSPIDVNGINKLAAEHYHTLYARVYDMKTCSLRLTNTYGPRQLIRHARQGFIGWFVNRALLGEKIQLFGGGGQKRDFTFVDDAVEAMLVAATNPVCRGEVYNLNGERLSLEEVARILLALCPKASVEKVPFPPEKKKIDIGDYFGSAGKFIEATGWGAHVTVADGLAKMVEYYRANQSHYLEKP